MLSPKENKKALIKELLLNTLAIFIMAVFFTLGIVGIVSHKYMALSIISLVVSIIAIIIFFIRRKRTDIDPSMEQIEILENLTKGDFSRRGTSKINTSINVKLNDELLHGISENLQELISSIDKSSSLQKAILESLNEGVIASEADGLIRLETPQVREILLSKNTADKEELLDGPEQYYDSESLQKYLPVKAVNYSRVWQVMDKALKKKEPVEEALEIQVDNDARCINVFAAPLNIAGEEMVLAVIRDDTLMRTLETQRKDFVANVSHELKTPLTSIIGYAELAKSPNRSKKEQRSFAEIISTESQKLLALVQDLLDLSEIESGNAKRVDNVETVYIYQVADEVLTELNSRAKECDVNLHMDVDPDLKIRANFTRVKQLIYNLVTNAIKYNKPGGDVWVKTELEDSAPVVYVADNGIGISETEQNRIFERFYRVDRSRSSKIKGTGLGLSIVKHVAALYDAEISLKSERDKGTIFKIKFPAELKI